MRLTFCCVDSAYCDFLRQTDTKVPYTRDEKSTRPFVGVVFSFEGLDYYAPLTSPKPKHLKMKNQIDFLKINNGEWGAINFNNMIPVHVSCLSEVVIHIFPYDSKADRDYKNLLSNQLSWCNANKDSIINKASKLYATITSGKATPKLIDRCCDFIANKEQYQLYCIQQNIQLHKTHT